MIKIINTVITGIECYGPMQRVQAGDNVAVLLRGVKLEDIKRGDIIVVKTGHIPHGSL